MLASELIRAQGIEVLALFFETPFFASPQARKSAESIALPIKVVDITDSHLEMLKNPKHGYGGHMNPCIDCHALMIRTAGEMLEQERASFIITGEVMGQRPMSQNLKALSMVASESGFQKLILRPLSAKRLPITLPEEKGWVNRERLLGFSGRSRKPQNRRASTTKPSAWYRLRRARRYRRYTPAPARWCGCRLPRTLFRYRRGRTCVRHRL